LKTRTYLIRRILGVIPILIGISFIAFCLINLSPSDPAEVALRVQEITPTPEVIQLMRTELGLDKPFLERYGRWLAAVLHGDFGKSYANNRSVAGEVGRAMPATLALVAATLAVISLVSLTAGVCCAVYEGRLGDIVFRGIVFWVTAMPSFWVGLLLMWFFAVKLNWLPTSGMERFSSVILPAVTLSLAYISTYFRLIRNTMIQNKKENCVFYARSLGLKASTVIRRIFKNSLQSSITALGMSIPKLIAGTVIVENIFAWPGIGRLCVTAIFNRDYPVIQAYVLIMAAAFVVCSLLVDVINVLIDPRLGKEG
jgi:nickel transport system permease protein